MPQIKPVETGAPEIAVSAKNISKNYGDVEALKDLTLEFPKGQLTSTARR